MQSGLDHHPRGIGGVEPPPLPAAAFWEIVGLFLDIEGKDPHLDRDRVSLVLHLIIVEPADLALPDPPTHAGLTSTLGGFRELTTGLPRRRLGAA